MPIKVKRMRHLGMPYPFGNHLGGDHGNAAGGGARASVV